jgi:hypothetical protein
MQVFFSTALPRVPISEKSQETRRLLLAQGRKKFGAGGNAEATLQSISDAERLERMAERIFDVSGWG